MGGFALELSGKEALRKLPSNVHKGADRVSRELISTNYVRKQNLKYEREMNEDIMPIYLGRDAGINGSVPVLNRKPRFKEVGQLDAFRRSSSGETPSKTMKLDL